MHLKDRQCVSVEFKNGSIATLNMIGGTSKAGRHIHVICEYGEIVGYVEDGKIILRVFDRNEVTYAEEVIDCSKEYESGDRDNSVAGHYGGDYFLMKDAVRYFNGISESVSVTKIEDSLNGHYVCYAAEISRKEGKILSLDELKR